MDKALQDELVKWLTGIREGADGAKNFLADQAPDVVRDMIALGRWEAAACLAGLLILAIALPILCQWFGRLACRESCKRSGADGLFFVLAIFCGVGTVLSLVWTASWVHTFIAAWVAPRIYVLEQLAALIGKASGK